MSFEVIDPASNADKSVIALKGAKNPDSPDRVKIMMDAKCHHDRFFFLMSAYDSGNNAHIADIVIRYKNGEKLTIPVTSGKNISDWSWKPDTNLSDGVIASLKNNRAIYLSWWDNPNPEREIEVFEFVSTEDAGYLILFGVTGRQNQTLKIKPGMVESLSQKLQNKKDAVVKMKKQLADLYREIICESDVGPAVERTIANFAEQRVLIYQKKLYALLTNRNK